MDRRAGILFHISSLPSPFGIGDFGPEAYHFVDFLKSSGQKIWQVLPLNIPDQTGSPYASVSSAALSTSLISHDQLLADGLLGAADLPDPAPVRKVDFWAAEKQKKMLVRASYRVFLERATGEQRSSFADFKKAEQHWLADFSLFMALKEQHGGKPWFQWPLEIADQEPSVVGGWKHKLTPEIEEYEYGQWLAAGQWRRLKLYANDHNIKIMGDLPFFVGHDSVDVWTNRELFRLTAANNPVTVSGVPPDYFSKLGQLWGEPQYDWQAMENEKFSWWIERFQRLQKLYDIIRLDHFRGYHKLWHIPFGSTTARIGEWREVPGRALFAALRARTSTIGCVAEDLGFITEDVFALRDSLGMPGMRVLLFAFSGTADNPHLPQNFVTNCVCYTGTHDNDTARNWVMKTGLPHERHNARVYLGSSDQEFAWKLIETGMRSRADTFIAPLQDILNLGPGARMNKPSTKRGNWQWRVKPNMLSKELAAQLKELTESAGR